MPLGHLHDGHFAVAGLVLLPPEVLRHLDLERRAQHRLCQPGEQAAKSNEAAALLLLEQLLGDRNGGCESSGLKLSSPGSFGAAISSSAPAKQPLQRRILLLKLRQPLRIVGLEPAVLAPPPVVVCLDACT